MNLDTFSTIIDELYRGAMEGRQHEFLDKLKIVTKSTKVFTAVGQQLIFDPEGEQWRSAFEQYFPIMSTDPFIKSVKSYPLGTPVSTNSFIQKQIQASHVASFYSVVDAYHVAAIKLFSAGIPVTVSIYRAKHSETYEEGILNLLGYLAPHINRAIMLSTTFSKLDFKDRAMQDIIELCQVPLAVVNIEGRIHFLNEQFEQWVNSNPMLHFSTHPSFINKIQQQNYLRILSYAQKNKWGEMILANNDVLRVISVPRSLADRLFFVIVMHAGAYDVSWCKIMFGLTPKENLLIEDLAKGLTLNEIAAKHFVSINTIKTQMKSVFSKTQTHSQQELLASLLKYQSAPFRVELSKC